MKSQQWKKIFRDLFANKSRTLLVILAISVGVVAFGGVFTSRTILIKNMNDQYKAVNPSSISVFLDSFDDNFVSWIKNKNDIVEAEGRSSRTVKVTTGGKTYNLNLYGYKNFEEIALNKIESESGTFPKDTKEILIERKSLPLLQKNVGDYFEIEMPDGKIKELKIVGIVHDLTIFPASMFPQFSGYTTTKTLSWMGFDNTYNELQLSVNPAYKTLPELEKFSDNFKEFLISRGFDVTGTAAKKPDEHWAKDVTNSFVLILTVIGTFSLFLSAFLVINTISALLAQQKKQIGILKAIGGTRKQIIQIYLMMTLFYGFLALIVAIPGSYFFGLANTKVVSDFLNLDISSYYIPTNILALELISAIIIPLIAGLIPVLNGTKISAREAIYDSGPTTQSKSKFMQKIMILLLLLPKQFSLAVRNVFRKKFRVIMTMGTLTVAGVLLISVINMSGSLRGELGNIMQMYQYDIEMMLGDDYPREVIEKKALSLEQIETAEARLYANAQKVLPDNTLSNSYVIMGVVYNSKLINPTITQGRWLEESDKNGAVVSSAILNDIPDLKVGNTITLQMDNKKSDWEVVGIISMTGQDKVIFTDIDKLAQAINKPRMATQLVVTVKPEEKNNLQVITNNLEETLNKIGIKVAGSMTVDTIIASNNNQFNFLIYFLLSMAVMVAIVGALGLAGTMSLNILERTREIGIMRSLGATNFNLYQQVISEGLTIGFLSWLIAIPLSFPATWLFSYVLGTTFMQRPMNPIYSFSGPITWLLIVSVISIIASLIPAKNAIRLTIRDTLSYE